MGPINLLLQTTPDKARTAVRTAYDELSHFTDPDYFTNEELESAKTILESEDLFDRDRNQAEAGPGPAPLSCSAASVEPC